MNNPLSQSWPPQNHSFSCLGESTGSTSSTTAPSLQTWFHLVVVVHGDDFTAGFIRLSLSLEEVENLNLIAASIEHVAHLNHGGGSAGPVSGAID